MSVAEPADRSPYHGYRFPPEIIAHAVWLYFRFHLSFRDVQDLLAERGVVVSHETIRQWCTKFGPTFAAGLRRRRVRAGDKWHLDEVLQTRTCRPANENGCCSGSNPPSTRSASSSRSAPSPTTSVRADTD